MSEYVMLQISDLADREQANRMCGSCPNTYIVPDERYSYQCLCGSKTLYPTEGGPAWAIPPVLIAQV